jgi:hypothetical protein
MLVWPPKGQPPFQTEARFHRLGLAVFKRFRWPHPIKKGPLATNSQPLVAFVCFPPVGFGLRRTTGVLVGNQRAKLNLLDQQDVDLACNQAF